MKETAEDKLPGWSPVDRRTHELAIAASSEAEAKAKEFVEAIAEYLPAGVADLIVNLKARLAYARVDQARKRGEMNDPQNYKPGITVYFKKDLLDGIREWCNQNDIDLDEVAELKDAPEDDLIALYMPNGSYEFEYFMTSPELDISPESKLLDGRVVESSSVIPVLKFDAVHRIEANDGSLFFAKQFYDEQDQSSEDMPTVEDSAEDADVEMHKQINESLSELIDELGLERTRDIMWLLQQSQVLDALRNYRNMDVVEVHNYGQD